MNKDLYLEVVPVGNVDFVNYIKGITKCIKFTDNEYKVYRYNDTMEYLSNNSLPTYIPYEHIKIQNDINFRMVVGYRIYDKDDSHGKELIDYVPWSDE